MSELGRLVDENCLMDVSQLEQDMACTNDHAGHLHQLTEKIQDPDVEDADAIRLALLYALRYVQACPGVPILCVCALKFFLIGD
jgi:vacuolar protein sorting-associated protein 45